MINYISTRGQAPVLDFEQVTLTGLAQDGGLYVPEALPRFSDAEVQAMCGDSYTLLAHKILRLFTGDDFLKGDIIKKSYAHFDHPEMAPLRSLGDNTWICELFHGPTLAFKDFALQFLGHAFERILDKTKGQATIVSATSGDTGSAAIDAFQNRRHVNMVVLHPEGRVSDVQRRQMTTVSATNIMNIAVQGDFDDCQNMVKAMFADRTFHETVRLSAVNSINWGRIAAQVVYYAYASLKIKTQTGAAATFVVPTGNFGNVYAGYIARMLGFPVAHLVIATNTNDILYRFFASGEMKKTKVTPTLSPSMDIQVSSNFERLVFDMYRHDGATTANIFARFQTQGDFTVTEAVLSQMRDIFSAEHADDAQTLETIRAVHNRFQYIVDPHTAVGIYAAEKRRAIFKDKNMVILATAHPAKFPAAVKQAIGLEPVLPARLSDLFMRPENYITLPNDRLQVQQAIKERFPT